MQTVINNLRNRPESHRRHIARVVMVFFTIILIALWIFSLGTNLGNTATQAKMKNDLQPLSALKDNLVGGYQDLSNPDQPQQ